VRPAKKTVFVYRANGTISFLRETDALDGEDLLPNFHLLLKEVFAEQFTDED